MGFRPPYDWITRVPGAGRRSGGSRVGWVQPIVTVRASVMRVGYGGGRERWLHPPCASYSSLAQTAPTAIIRLRTWANEVEDKHLIDKISAWPHLNLVSLLVTAIGLFITVGYAKRAAAQSAEAASASREAKRAVAKVDAVAETARAIELLRMIRFRLEAADWDRIAESCEDVMTIMAKLKASSTLLLDEKSRDTVTKLDDRMEYLARVALSAAKDPEIADIPEIREILLKQTISLAGFNTALREDANSDG